MYMMHKQVFKKGFTLIEVMVSITIFSIVMTIAMGAIFSIVSANKKAQALNAVINSLNFSVEAMVRDLRTGYHYYCGTGKSSNTDVRDCISGDSEVSFVSTQSASGGVDQIVTYRLNTTDYTSPDGSTIGGITKKVGTGGSEFFLTSQEVDIKETKFYVTNSGTTNDTDYKQARILLVIKGEGRVAGVGVTPFSLQTFISQRKTDI
jgi:prepilin-type N-terminal cleavage/methylation domain-containing protein